MPETSLSEMAVYTARPTVRIDAEEYPMVSQMIIAMEMTERESGLSALELRIGNWASDPAGGVDFAFEDNSILKLGATIAIYSGDESAPQEVFQGTITGLEGVFSDSNAPELIVLAEDALQQARMTRRTVTHTDVTIADLASDLASQIGLTPVITGLSDNIGTQVQLNESDLGFLRRMLARYDGDLQVVGRELHVSPRADVRRGELELQFSGQLRRARVLADLAHQVSEITVSGWDAAQGQRVTGRSTGAHAGPGAGRSGADVLREAIGARSHHIGHLAASSSDEAQALADAAFDSRARQFVTIEGTAEGNAALRVGTHVSLRGMGSRFDNTYYVVRACHRFDLQRGYETDFTAECAFWGAG